MRVLDSPEEYECEANDERVEEDGFARHWREEERLDAREGGGHDEFRLFSVSLSHARTRTHTLSLARSLPRVRLYSMQEIRAVEKVKKERKNAGGFFSYRACMYVCTRYI